LFVKKPDSKSSKILDVRSIIFWTSAYLLDPVQELGPDDAAALPDAGQLAEVEVPALLDALGTNDIHALGVAADLGGVESLQKKSMSSSCECTSGDSHQKERMV
jgi:hypothetical protein